MYDMPVVWKQQRRAIRIRLLISGIALSASACSLHPVNAPRSPHAEPSTSLQATARIHDRALSEISGLAASRRQPGILWAINDSGQPAALHALDLQGRLRGRWPIAADNRDWESLDLARIGDRDYLVIADIGDNLGRHRDYHLHFVEEPDIGNPAVRADARTRLAAVPLVPWHTLHFRYPDGSHNAEAMTVSRGAIYVIDKQHRLDGTLDANRAFRLPLPAPDAATIDRLVVATPLGPVNLGTRPLSHRMLRWLTGFDLGQPTGLVMTRDDQQAFLLTYRAVLRFRRHDGETWQHAFRRTPDVLHRHTLRQAEALTLDAAGRLWLTSEGLDAPLQAVVLSANASPRPAPP